MITHDRNNLMQGLTSLYGNREVLPWDEYFPAMAQTDFFSGYRDTPAAKSFFIRQAPFGGSYAILGGITDTLRVVHQLRFNTPLFQHLMHLQGYKPEFLQWLADQQRLKVQIYAPWEGSIITPHEPAITVVGPLPFVRLFEGIVDTAVNFATLSMTKWHRLKLAANWGPVFDMSRRRAQNETKATLYAMLAGVDITSNSDMLPHFNFSVKGTMGHEFIQSRGSVYQAFTDWLTHNPDKPFGLVDTISTKHDFPLWLDAVYQFREAIVNSGAPTWGDRNDSGDLPQLTMEQHARFLQHPLAQIDWFVERYRRILTNDIDEHTILTISRQIMENAHEYGLDPQDILGRIIWAAGTKPGTCSDQPSLGGVAKLMQVEDIPTIKLAMDAQGMPGIKTSIPGLNLSAQIWDRQDEFHGVLIYPAKDTKITSNGKLSVDGKPVSTLDGINPNNPNDTISLSDYFLQLTQYPLYNSLHGGGFESDWDDPIITEVSHFVRSKVMQLPWQYRRLTMPHVIRLFLTPDLFKLRQDMIGQRVLHASQLR